MVQAKHFLDEAHRRGFDFYTGVPCSFLTPLINRVISDRGTRYVGAASEGEAVGIASGAWLAGRSTVVMCQNSGLGNTINPVTSLNWPFRIPTLMLVTLRGEPGLNDEPQHELMGQITKQLLDDIRVANAPFPEKDEAVGAALDTAIASMRERSLPFGFIVRKGTVANEALDEVPIAVPSPGEHSDRREGGKRPMRYAALERVVAAAPTSAALIATTGFCGRELYMIDDRPQHLYQVGSMGCASAMGLGVALNVDRPVIVLDGDGAALMKMGSLATIGAQAPKNLIHILLDNGVHESTGGQATVSPGVEFTRVALACGYRAAAACDSLKGLESALSDALKRPGPHMIHIRLEPGTIDNLVRPSVKPPEVARRFRAFLASE
jgi:phosphonopyruvate decarboxylase